MRQLRINQPYRIPQRFETLAQGLSNLRVAMRLLLKCDSIVVINLFDDVGLRSLLLRQTAKHLINYLFVSLAVTKAYVGVHVHALGFCQIQA